MLSADYGAQIRYATHDRFIIAKQSVLMGQALADVRILENSLLRFGLLTPLTVLEKNGQLIVLDGRKRLTAIRRLGFRRRLPRSLTHVPFEILTDKSEEDLSTPSLTASRTLFESVDRAFRSGLHPSQIAQRFQISSQPVRDLLTLSRLSTPIRQAFFDRMISFPQAAAYASLPGRYAQTRLFQKLGPFAKAGEICNEALRTGRGQSQKVAA